ncbi:MAG: tetratricopeptide repeat protein [bacterium]|nr:tetratricopeptide repeat protein [bacterium]
MRIIGGILRPVIALAIIISVLAGCGDKGTEPQKTAEEFTNEGWDAYQEGDYERALEAFNQAVDKDSACTEAYNGLGWANAKSNGLSAAVTNFNQCLSLYSQDMEAKAGLAFVYNAQNQYKDSADKAEEVLEASPDWSFPYDSTLDSGDLHLLLAQNYYALAEFENSLAEVKLLNSDFTADVSAPEGKAALAAEIERLKDEV